jgi:hypothetical protein
MQSENKKNNRMTDYREQLLPQLVRQLEDIDLPESSIAEREKALKEEKNEAGEELTEEQISQRMEAHRDRLRRDFLVDHIFPKCCSTTGRSNTGQSFLECCWDDGAFCTGFL